MERGYNQVEVKLETNTEEYVTFKEIISKINGDEKEKEPLF